MPKTTQTRHAAPDRRSTTDQQRERKRIQNRISQRCFREKQGSYIQHLERFVSTIENTEGFGSREATERLELIHENHALRESLLQMKKKLLSLGAQVTSLADSPTRHETTDRGAESSCLPSSESQARDPDLPVGTPNATAVDTDRAGNQRWGADAYALPNSQSLETGSLCDSRMSQYAPEVLGIATSTPAAEPSQQETLDLVVPLNILDTDLSTFFGAKQVLFSPYTGITMFKATNTSVKCPLLLMETKIQNMMQEFNIQSFHQTLGIRPFASDLSSREIHQLDNEILTNIVQLAMRAMLHGTPIGGYSHFICPTCVVEKILVWRTHPTSENRNQVEAPFRPTILQHRFPKHHPAIDLLYWDELRDQLILCEERVEIGAVVYRWLLSSVIEYPDYSVAVSALELFVFLASPASFPLETTMSPETRSIPLVDVTDRDVGEYVQGLMMSYRLNCFSARKLPASMAKEYSFLDLSNSKAPWSW
ncbi:hypothetical protein BJX99DRAFT_260403 [Aspergillus californicus]